MTAPVTAARYFRHPVHTAFADVTRAVAAYHAALMAHAPDDTARVACARQILAAREHLGGAALAAGLVPSGAVSPEASDAR